MSSLSDALDAQLSLAASATPCPDVFEVPADLVGTVRQGDLYFYRYTSDPIPALPGVARIPLAPGVSVPLCEGSHILAADIGTATPGLVPPPEVAPVGATPETLTALAGHLLSLPLGGLVSHAEHPDVHLPPGTWGTYRQLDLATLAAVID